MNKKMSARTLRRCLYGICAGGVLSAGFTMPMAEVQVVNDAPASVR